jgi:two-component system sensor histidine kinase RegB
MALSIRSGGRMLAAARAGLVDIGSPDRWLIAMRWVAVCGMLVTTLVGWALVPSLPLARILVVLAAILVVNGLWFVRVLRGVAPNRTVLPQIAGDVLALTVVLWFSGGLTNPFAGFLCFQIVLAGMLGSRRTTVLVAVLAVGAAVVLDFARPLALTGTRFSPATLDHVASVVSVAALGAFTGVFVFVFASRLEQLRAESARAERLAGLGRTVAAMCHELNTPLGTILIAGKDLALLGREIGSGEIEQLADTVADGARRAADIIGMMRGSISPDARREPLDLISFVRRYAEQELDRKGFRGERVVDCSGVAEVRVVRAALCQVLTNLIANAVDATHGMAGARIAVEVAVRDGGVDITVRDNGPGIDPDVARHLGEPFNTTKADRGGSGLGLYVSNLLAERMGGALHLDTHAGRGTSATLRLAHGGGQISQQLRAVDGAALPAAAQGGAP